MANTSDKPTREHIVEQADLLFYKQGFEHTSFADIADAVRISRGNFYYHFKTKDDILDAVIDRRLDNTRKLLQNWESESADPADRIKRYIHIVLSNWSKIKYYGCPVGTLCTELAKLNHSSRDEATKVFDLFRAWLSRQFKQLGHKRTADALAMHVLAWSQGVATLSSTYQDQQFAKNEIKQICAWLDALQT